MLKQQNDTTGFVYATLGVLYSVMLAFVVVTVWGQHDDAATAAESESVHASSLYSDLTLFPDQKKVEPALAALAIFSRAVVEKEYPAMDHFMWETATQPSVESKGKLDTLLASISMIVPASMQEQSLFSEVVKDINGLTEEREKRLIMARRDLPPVVWVVVLVGGLITVGFPALFGVENLKTQLVINGLLGFVVGSVIFVVICLNFPFTGNVRILPTGYEYLVDLARW